MNLVIRDSYGLVVRFDLLDGHEDAFEALTEETLAEVGGSEPGTLIYTVHCEPASPSVRLFYEVYRDVVASEEHEGMPDVERFLAERAEHLRADPTVWRLPQKDGVARAFESIEGA